MISSSDAVGPIASNPAKKRLSAASKADVSSSVIGSSTAVIRTSPSSCTSSFLAAHNARQRLFRAPARILCCYLFRCPTTRHGHCFLKQRQSQHIPRLEAIDVAGPKGLRLRRCTANIC